MNKEKVGREMEIEKIKNLNNESDVWQFLNSERNRRVSVENKISKTERKNHFRKLLEGLDERIVGRTRKLDEEIGEKEKVNISAAEI